MLLVVNYALIPKYCQSPPFKAAQLRELDHLDHSKCNLFSSFQAYNPGQRKDLGGIFQLQRNKGSDQSEGRVVTCSCTDKRAASKCLLSLGCFWGKLNFCYSRCFHCILSLSCGIGHFLGLSRSGCAPLIISRSGCTTRSWTRASLEALEWKHRIELPYIESTHWSIYWSVVAVRVEGSSSTVTSNPFQCRYQWLDLGL